MRLTIHGSGTLHQASRYRGHLRVPIAEGQATMAEQVVNHFQRMVES